YDVCTTFDGDEDETCFSLIRTSAKEWKTDDDRWDIAPNGDKTLWVMTDADTGNTWTASYADNKCPPTADQWTQTEGNATLNSVDCHSPPTECAFAFTMAMAGMCFFSADPHTFSGNTVHSSGFGFFTPWGITTSSLVSGNITTEGTFGPGGVC